MLLRRAVAAITGNTHRGERRILIAINRIGYWLRLTRMTDQALDRDRPGEVRRLGLFISGSHIPLLARCVIGDRRLKKMIPHLDEISKPVITGTNNVSQLLLNRCLTARPRFGGAGRARLNRKVSAA